MKKAIIIIVLILILLMASMFIPVRKGEVWVNDDPIADVGHMQKCYYNIYGYNITFLFNRPKTDEEMLREKVIKLEEVK